MRKVRKRLNEFRAHCHDGGGRENVRMHDSVSILFPRRWSAVSAGSTRSFPLNIRIERALCTAQLKNCVLIAPEVFELDAEGKAVVKNPAGASEGQILRAALACQQRAV